MIEKFVIAEDCVPCILNMCLNGMRIAEFPDSLIREIFKESLRDIFTEEFIWNITSAEVVEILLKKIIKKTGQKDIFKKIKDLSNNRLLKIYNNLKEDVNLIDSIKLSILGNTIDVMVSQNPDENLEDILKKSVHNFEIDDSMYEKFLKILKNSKSILIIGDNAGEAVLDKLFIEVLKRNFEIEIFYAARNEPALNDITYREAIEIGLNKICNVISNGVIGPLPGTVLSRCSEEFLKVFYSVDLVISKGGGNFESLLNEKNLPENTCFMLMCKCNVHSKIFNLPVGKGIIYFHNI